MAYAPSPMVEADVLDLLFTNVNPRRKKSTWRSLDTPKQFEDAQRRAQSNSRTFRIAGTSSTGPR